MKTSNYSSFFLLFCITFSSNAMNVNGPGENLPLLPAAVPKKPWWCKAPVLALGALCLSAIITAAIVVPVVLLVKPTQYPCYDDVYWNRFDRTCSLHSSPGEWATILCQRELLAHASGHGACAPACLERNRGDHSTVPTDWEETTDVLWHDGCDQEGLDGENLYMVCDNSTWGGWLKNIFNQNNVSSCEIPLKNGEGVGVVIPKDYWWWAIDPAVYQEIVDHSQDAKSDTCKPFFEHAESLTQCEVSLSSDDQSPQEFNKTTKLARKYYEKRKNKKRRNH